jgi:hypothetical protein
MEQALISSGQDKFRFELHPPDQKIWQSEIICKLDEFAGQHDFQIEIATGDFINRHKITTPALECFLRSKNFTLFRKKKSKDIICKKVDWREWISDVAEKQEGQFTLNDLFLTTQKKLPPVQKQFLRNNPEILRTYLTRSTKTKTTYERNPMSAFVEPDLSCWDSRGRVPATLAVLVRILANLPAFGLSFWKTPQNTKEFLLWKVVEAVRFDTDHTLAFTELFEFIHRQNSKLCCCGKQLTIGQGLREAIAYFGGRLSCFQEIVWDKKTKIVPAKNSSAMFWDLTATSDINMIADPGVVEAFATRNLVVSCLVDSEMHLTVNCSWKPASPQPLATSVLAFFVPKRTACTKYVGAQCKHSNDALNSNILYYGAIPTVQTWLTLQNLMQHYDSRSVKDIYPYVVTGERTGVARLRSESHMSSSEQKACRTMILKMLDKIFPNSKISILQNGLVSHDLCFKTYARGAYILRHKDQKDAEFSLVACLRSKAERLRISELGEPGPDDNVFEWFDDEFGYNFALQAGEVVIFNSDLYHWTEKAQIGRTIFAAQFNVTKKKRKSPPPPNRPEPDLEESDEEEDVLPYNDSDQDSGSSDSDDDSDSPPPAHGNGLRRSSRARAPPDRGLMCV